MYKDGAGPAVFDVRDCNACLMVPSISATRFCKSLKSICMPGPSSWSKIRTISRQMQPQKSAPTLTNMTYRWFESAAQQQTIQLDGMEQQYKPQPDP